MKHIIESNYNSIVKRGKINVQTTEQDFIDKIQEEFNELKEAVFGKKSNRNEEIADIILTCLNYARHYNVDIEKQLITKINTNNKRHD